MYKNDGPYDAYVDITRIGELYQVTRSTPLTIGGGVTLTNVMELLNSIGSTNPDYWYATILAEHIGKIGSVPVRNVRPEIINLNSKQLMKRIFVCEIVGKHRWQFDVETCAQGISIRRFHRSGNSWHQSHNQYVLFLFTLKKMYIPT